MFSIQVRLDSGSALRSRTDAKQVISRATSDLLRQQGQIYLNLMIQEAPVGETGVLAHSHILRLINQYRAEVTNTAPYAEFVHEGTRPHMPPASSGLPYPVRRAIAAHGTRPNRWMARAAERGDQEIQGLLDQMAARIGQEIM